MRRMSVLALAFAATLSLASDKKPEFRKAILKGADAFINLSIVDDDGCAVANANVRVFMGMNFKPKGYWLDGATDENGRFTIQGKTCGDEVDMYVSKEGYYDSHHKLCFSMMGAEREVRDGKWQPYGEHERLILRKKKRPAPLRVFGFGGDKSMPATNVWVGVDMYIGDFVKPYGTGEVPDFEIKAEWDGKVPVDCSHCEAKIRFRKDFSGGYFENQVKESEYPYPYHAMQGADYHVKEWQVVGRDANGYVEPRLNETVLVTRTRCVADTSGHLASACYGYIRVFAIDADWDRLPNIRLAGVFNPTPNDTNLEAKR